MHGLFVMYIADRFAMNCMSHAHVAYLHHLVIGCGHHGTLWCNRHRCARGGPVGVRASGVGLREKRGVRVAVLEAATVSSGAPQGERFGASCPGCRARFPPNTFFVHRAGEATVCATAKQPLNTPIFSNFEPSGFTYDGGLIRFLAPASLIRMCLFLVWLRGDPVSGADFCRLNR